MEDVVKIASYICLRYRRRFGRKIDEMKLHKLLYFTQRESIIRTGEPLFGDCFEAWKYGPVLVAIRQRYKNNTLHEELPARCKEVIVAPGSSAPDDDAANPVPIR